MHEPGGRLAAPGKSALVAGGADVYGGGMAQPTLSPAAMRLLNDRSYAYDQAILATRRALSRKCRVYGTVTTRDSLRDHAIYVERTRAQAAACEAFIRAVQYLGGRR